MTGQAGFRRRRKDLSPASTGQASMSAVHKRRQWRSALYRFDNCDRRRLHVQSPEERAAKTRGGGHRAGENDSDRSSDDTLLELADRMNCLGTFSPNRGDFWYDRRRMSSVISSRVFLDVNHARKDRMS